MVLTSDRGVVHALEAERNKTEINPPSLNYKDSLTAFTLKHVLMFDVINECWFVGRD